MPEDSSKSEYDAYKRNKNFKLPYLPKYEFIETEERAIEVCEILSTHKVLSVDTETTGLDPYTSRILLLQIATPDICYILNCIKVRVDVWNKVLSDPNILKLFQNAKFDYKMLKVHAKVSVKNMFDTMLAEIILTAGRASAFIKLDALARKYTGISLDKEIRENFVNKLILEFSEEEKLYAANDALILFSIYESQVQQLQRDDLIDVAVLEFNAIKPIAEMELSGVLIDKVKWRTHLEIARQKRDAVEAKLMRALVPVSSQLSVFGECTINLDSPKQLLEALNSLGIKVESTGEDAIKRERHPVIDWLLEWRGWNTILKRYGESLLDLINPKTGRIHTDFFQIGAASGRSSSRNPNTQNMPRYDEKDPNSLDLRSCFIAPKGKKMIVADYSQQELRCLAELSFDKNLMHAYLHNEDLHTKTASYIYGVPMDKVTKAQRQTAKTINFAVSYGASKYRVADELRIDVDLAEKIIDNYFKAYPGVKTYLQYTNNFAIQNGYTLNVDKRRRYFNVPSTDDPDYKKKLGSINREAGNTRIQGSCSSVTRLAMTIFLNKCEEEGLDVELAVVVHDEIGCYANESISKRVAKVLEDSMVEGWNAYFRVVPMKVDAVISDTWKH